MQFMKLNIARLNILNLNLNINDWEVIFMITELGWRLLFYTRTIIIIISAKILLF